MSKVIISLSTAKTPSRKVGGLGGNPFMVRERAMENAKKAKAKAELVSSLEKPTKANAVKALAYAQKQVAKYEKLVAKCKLLVK
jgi:hypothetical protein